MRRKQPFTEPQRIKDRMPFDRIIYSYPINDDPKRKQEMLRDMLRIQLKQAGRIWTTELEPYRVGDKITREEPVDTLWNRIKHYITGKPIPTRTVEYECTHTSGNINNDD